MSDELVPQAMPVSDDAPLTADTPCIHCGYNLRGLVSTGRCPECGQQVVDSTRGNLLHFADARWLDTLRNGATLKLWNILIMLLLGVGAGVFTSMPGSMVVQMIVNTIGAALGLWATFLITSQEPRIAMSEDPMTLRRVVRACAIAGVVGGFGPQLGAAGAFAGGGDVVAVAIAIVFVLLSLAGVVVLFGELVYLRRFARRIPNEKLVKSTTIVIWLMPAAIAFMIVAGAVAGIAGGFFTGTAPPPPCGPGPGPSSIVVGVMGFAGCFGLLLMIVGGVLYISLLIRYRKAFAKAATLSRAGASA